uniref:Transferrin-like domain-containing protein n=1 Tax=Varanus komodoensis TaxID=61221 RepID=A0A8D2J8Z9_VARKO
ALLGIKIFLLCSVVLALCLATSPVKWCTTSTAEQEKCSNLQRCLNKQQLPNLPQFGCVRKTDYLDCIRAIANKEADAITLDGGQIFDANLHPHNLKPVIAEVYRRIDGGKFDDLLCCSCGEAKHYKVICGSQRE